MAELVVFFSSAAGCQGLCHICPLSSCISWILSDIYCDNLHGEEGVVLKVTLLNFLLLFFLQIHSNGISNGSVPNGNAVSVGDSGGGGISDKKND